MSRLPEITDLLARLASNLKTLGPTTRDGEEEEEKEQQTCQLSISNLNQSLNLSDNSRVRVLDTALSLMCFKSTQVGGSISQHNCAELIEACADIFGKLEGHRMLSHLLSYAVVRVAALASCYQNVSPLIHFLDVKSIDGRSTTVLKLLSHMPRESTIKNHEIPLRLLLWYLDPLTLKKDVAKILQETMERPFLHLNNEFHERNDWRSIITCLALSPAMFIQIRALLHNWFLMTGRSSVLELLNELVSLIMDVVSRPSWWGIPVEVGLKLPFSNAYFPYMHHLLRILVGPVSSNSFLHLVHIISQPVSCARKHSDSTIKRPASKATTVDYKSNWALAMNFPDWFLFASVLLFSEQNFQDNFHSKCMLGEPRTVRTHDLEPPCLSAAAAKYMAWILSPISESHQDLLADCLAEISKSWVVKQFGSENHNTGAAGYRKKLKKPKFDEDKVNCTLAKDDNCQAIVSWLEKFQNIYAMYWNETIRSCKGKSFNGPSNQCNVIFRRIPLGILIGGSRHINEDGCEVLLHYVTTGTILKSRTCQTAGLKRMKQHPEQHEDSITCTEESAKKEAVAGACLVFNLTDVAESMSASMFEMEERGLDFVCQLKARVNKYLLKCVRRILQIKIDQDGVQMLTDICNRLVRWRHQGREIFQSHEDLDDVLSALNHILSSS
ncbi:uncharacterized protein LOC131157617 isoform X2 [Malania oleifera]|uniref:uncharacterized protein LOC131157617 isoform X2 n=1 Tax=Malania oleifera TaxID=397392 RepID=UPI0025AE57A0|nr:uncharacterized protein LOC131157617 isoform X2 [Malania oleifera]